MKVIEYIGEVLPDGHLSLPDEIQKELGLGPHCSVRITITVETSHALDEQKGWEVFRRLGQDAIGGKLFDASTKHELDTTNIFTEKRDERIICRYQRVGCH